MLLNTCQRCQKSRLFFLTRRFTAEASSSKVNSLARKVVNLYDAYEFIQLLRNLFHYAGVRGVPIVLRGRSGSVVSRDAEALVFAQKKALSRGDSRWFDAQPISYVSRITPFHHRNIFIQRLSGRNHQCDIVVASAQNTPMGCVNQSWRFVVTSASKLSAQAHTSVRLGDTGRYTRL